ncbi:IS5/IS1182 family transposase, partial [Lactobacillus helveticus]
WSKDQFSLFKNKNREKKRPIKLKLRVELIVFQYLRVGYFPDTYSICTRLKRISIHVSLTNTNRN